jgi:hypothetical protein
MKDHLDQIKKLKARVAELEEALACVVPTCESLHHKKAHRHELKDQCPVVALVQKAKGVK